MNAVLEELAISVVACQHIYHPFWIDFFYSMKEHRALFVPYYFLRTNSTCLTYPYDIMKVNEYKKIVRYDYCLIMHQYNYIKANPIEIDDWKENVLLNRSYEAFLEVPILPEIKTLIYSFL
jgi:hypothetical protein